MELGGQAWPDVVATDVLLLPLGSTEQHGPHLPLDTDAQIARAIAVAAGRKLEIAVGPVLPFGASGEHAGFAGTLSIGTEVLQQVVVELVRSARLTFDRVVLVNGHGGNHQGVAAAADQLVAEGHDVTSWSPSIPGGDAHAGRTETSLMLAIDPGSVTLAKAQVGNTAPLREILPDMQRGGVAAVSDSGVLGDPTGASAAEGGQLLATLVDQLVAAIS